MPLIEQDLIVGADDLGHDVKFFGATSGRYMLWDESDDALEFSDNAIIKLGNGGDLRIEHTGSASNIYNTTGNLNFINYADDKDIVFQSDDGSGGVETYFFLDGSTGHTQFPDGKKLQFGSSNDMFIEHDGSNSYISSDVGTFYIRQTLNDGDLVLTCDDGSGGNTAYITLDGSATTVEIAKATTIQGSLSITGDGSNATVLSESSNGEFKIDTVTDITLDAGGGDIILSDDGEIFGTFSRSGNDLQLRSRKDNGDIYLRGVDDSSTINALQLDMSDAGTAIFNHDIKIADDGIIKVGNDTDLYITHDASNSHIVNSTGDLKITQNANDKDIIFNCDDDSGGNTAYLTLDGSAGHITVQKEMQFEDNVFARFGTGSDMKIYHNGTTTFIENNTGDLQITNFGDDKDIIFKTDDGSGGTTEYLSIDGSVEKVIVNKPSQRTFEVSDASTHGDANGDIVYFGGTTSMSAGKIYHYKANGTWELADADAASTSDGLLAVAIGAASDTNGMLIRGMVTLDHDPGNLGDVLFLSTTAGEATGTAPSGSGDIVRVVGYLLGGAHGQIYFNPDGAFVEVA